MEREGETDEHEAMPQDANDPDWQTRPARETDLPWILDTSNRTAFANGFTPRAAIADHIHRGSYTVLELRGQHAAFMLTSGGKRAPFRIVQSAVSAELWRQGYGEMLFRAIALRALDRPLAAATCAVREGLESNAFWRALGAMHVDTTAGGKARGKRLLHYAWSTGRLHAHAIQAATDPRHRLPERETAQRIMVLHGFLPHTVAVPRTPTGDAHHHAGIAIAILPKQKRQSTRHRRTPEGAALHVPTVRIPPIE